MAKKNEKELTAELVMKWFGDDEKEDIACYIAGILNSLKLENKSPRALSLWKEILTYEPED